MAAQTVDSWAARWGCDFRGRGGKGRSTMNKIRIGPL